MTITGNQLLTGFSRFIGDLEFPQGLTTTGAGSTTSLVDTALCRFGDDYLLDWYVRITENVNGNQYLNRRITDFVGSTGTATLAPAFAGATASATPTVGANSPSGNAPFNGSMGFLAIYAAALTAAQHARIANLCREFYEVSL